MAAFRFYLAAVFLLILAYTVMVIARHGWDILPIFFGDIAKLGWPGQFNVDFSSFLLLSALWVAWRNHFSAAGLGLAILAAIGGGLFLSAYLLIVSFEGSGNFEQLLLGPRRASQR